MYLSYLYFFYIIHIKGLLIVNQLTYNITIYVPVQSYIFAKKEEIITKNLAIFGLLYKY